MFQEKREGWTFDQSTPPPFAFLKFPYVTSTTTVRIHNYIWSDSPCASTKMDRRHACIYIRMGPCTRPLARRVASRLSLYAHVPMCGCARAGCHDILHPNERPPHSNDREFGIELKFNVILRPNYRWWAPRIWCSLPVLYQLVVRVNWYSVSLSQPISEMHALVMHDYIDVVNLI